MDNIESLISQARSYLHRSHKLWFYGNLSLMLVLFVLNPFGLRDASSQTTHQIIARMMAPFYPHNKQDVVTVVQVDDAVVKALGESYPLSHGTWGRLIQTIAEYKPKAIFVDILFTQNRDPEAMSSLARVLRKYGNEQGETPVYIADYVVDGKSQLLPELQDGVLKARVNWQFYGDRYPLIIREGKTEATPAWQLAKQYCRSEDCNLPVEPLEPMTIYWGSRVHPDMVAILGDLEECNHKESRFLDSLGLFGSELFYGLLSSQNYHHNSRQSCTYSRMIYAHQLIQDDEDKRETIELFLTDRVVVLGATINGIPDYIQSPVHGLVPGMYWHAMAADNLITFGDEYWKEPGSFHPGIQLNWLNVIEILLSFLVLCIVLYFRQRGKLDKLPYKFVCVGVVALISVILAGFLIAFCDYTPVNVLGITSLVTCTMLTMRTGNVPNKIGTQTDLDGGGELD